MGLISWIVVGALAGWIASMLAGKNEQMGAMANIGVGIIGAFIGGFILKFFGIDGVTGFNLWSILVATMGAFLLLVIIGKLKG